MKRLKLKKEQKFVSFLEVLQFLLNPNQLLYLYLIVYTKK